MNALCYKIVFSKRLGALVAVGEHTAGQGKAAGTGVRTVFYASSTSSASADGFLGALKSVCASVAITCFSATTMAAAPAANTLPTGYSVNSGSVAVSTTGANMSIQQSTDKASVNWQSFSIGSAASVNIQQNSASSVLLNRVVGNDPSQIYGKLSANGQIILINPNGVVFGKGGSVTASAFTASTFGMTEEDFNIGKHKFTRNGSTAGLTVEEGASINTVVPGGYVALISSNVNNQGRISTKQGAVVMAAAEAVTLPSALTDNVGIPLSSKVRLELAPSTINASIENGGTITTEGGQVFMRAAAVVDAVSKIADAQVTNSGSIDTTGAQGGRVDILADHGTVRVSGHITTNSTQGTAGGDIYIGRDEQTNVLAAVGDVSGAILTSSNGFLETSGEYLKSEGVNVSAKDWLLDPNNVEINLTSTAGTAGNSVVKAGDISTALGNGTSVTIATGSGTGSISSATNVAITGSGGTQADGNILVNSAITSTYNGTSAPTLTLTANNGITVGADIKATGTGGLNITMTANGLTSVSNNPANSYGIKVASGVSLLANGSGTGGSQNGNISLTGTSYSPGGSGVLINPAIVTGNNILIAGTSSVASGSVGNGVSLWRGGTTTITATNTTITGANDGLVINGTLTGGGSGNAVNTTGNGGVGSGVFLNSSGNIQISGTQSANASNTASALYLNGVQAKAGTATNSTGGDLTLKATAANSNSIAINFIRGGGELNNNGYAQVYSATKGNVIIQSNQGAIVGQDFSTGPQISGQSVFIDNTGGAINTTTGVITAGTGTSSYVATVGSGWTASWTPGGVSFGANSAYGAITYLNGVSATSATGFLTVVSSSSAFNGFTIAGPISSPGNVSLTGIYAGNSASNNTGLLINGSVTTTGVGNLTLQGTSTNGIGINVTAALSANNIQATGQTGNAASPSIQTGSASTITGRSDVSLTGINTGIPTAAPLNLAGTIIGASGKSINLTGGITGAGGITSNGATVKFSNPYSLQSSYSGVIVNGTGTGSVQNNQGAQTLTGTSTYSGGTNVNAGTLQIGDGGTTGTLGTGAVSIAANSNLNFYRSDTSQIAVNNVISSASTGVINLLGTGVVNQSSYLLGANNSNLLGSVKLTSSRLVVNNANQLGNGTASINVNSGSGLYVVGITLNNGLTLAGNGWNESTGLLGALRFGNATYAGNITLGADARISALGSVGNVIGAIGGAKNLEFSSGEVRLTNSGNNYAGTTVSGGTLSLGLSSVNSGTTGSLGSGSVTNNAILNFNRTDTMTVGNAINGTGAVNQTGGGTTILTGSNTYAGTTTISGGTLQIGDGGTTGSLGAGSVTNNANLTFNRSNSMTVGNAINGTGAVNQTGGGTTILTGSNAYAGTTTISGGTLQIGAGATTGSLGAGSVTNNANLTFNRSNTMTVGNAINGMGAINQTGGGTTILTASNAYAGITKISAGTLQIGNGGATGTLGSGNVVLSNGGSLVYKRNVDTAVNNAIFGNGNVSATITGNLDVANTINLSTSGNTVNLTASGNITQSAGSISATNLYLTATNGSIATSTNRINSNVTNLAMKSSGDQFATQTNALSLAATTTGTGNIDVKTTNGTLTITSVNGVNGVTTTGIGNVTLSGTSNTTGGLVLSRAVTADTGKITLTGTATGTNGTGLNIGYAVNVISNGDVELTGTTTANNRVSGTFAGVINAGTVSGKNISLKATASDTSATADVLGYYGAGGNLIATEKLKAEAEAKGAGVGFYMYSGNAQSGTGVDIKGTGNRESGFGLDGGAQVLNKVTTGTASGDVVLTGSTDSSTHASIGLYKATIENKSTDGGTQITATKGDILASYGSANTITNAGSKAITLSAGPSSATDVGAIDGTNLTITQNGNGGVEIKTSGTGNVKAPKIINNGRGNVIVAAGTAIGAGTGTGGQVKTVVGNSITNDTSQTLIYSGNAADTGDLASLIAGNNLGKLATLYLTNAGTTEQNAKVNTAFGTPASNTAPVQLMLRENLQFETRLNPVSLTKNFADADPTDAAIKAALKGANTSTETTLTTATNTGGKLFKVGTSELIDTLSGSFNGTAGTTRGAGSYNYSAASSKTNTTVASTDATRSVAQLVVKSADITPVPSPVTPSTNPGRVKVTSDLANPFALASAEDFADNTCSANSVENCYCEESAATAGVSICYQPKSSDASGS